MNNSELGITLNRKMYHRQKIEEGNPGHSNLRESSSIAEWPNRVLLMQIEDIQKEVVRANRRENKTKLGQL